MSQKWVESSKGSRPFNKHSNSEIKKYQTAHSKLAQEYEELTIAVEDAWNDYMGHLCFKCVIPGVTCNTKSDLRKSYTALQAKQLRMELFSNVGR